MTLPVPSSSARVRPRRRTATEVQRQILAAAQERFAAEGYAGAATRRIAVQAEVAETLIFRHFGSKAGLYRSAVLESAEGLVREFGRPIEMPATASDHSPPERLGAWVRHVLVVVNRNKGLVAAFLNHGLEFIDDPDLTSEVGALRRELFHALDRGAGRALGIDVVSSGFTLAVRSVFATVVSVCAYSTLFDISDGDARPSAHREDLVQLGTSILLAAAPQPAGA